MSFCSKSPYFNNIQHYGDPTLIQEVEVNLKYWIDWAFLGIGAWQEVVADTSGIYGGSFSALQKLVNKEYISIRKDWVYETGVNYYSPSLKIHAIQNDPIYQDKNKVTLKTPDTHSFSSGNTIKIINNTDDLNGEYQVFAVPTSDTIILNDEQNAASDNGEIFGVFDPKPPKIFVNGIEQLNTFKIDYPNGKVIFNNSLQDSDKVSASYSFRNVQTYIAGYLPQNIEVQNYTFDPTHDEWEAMESGGGFTYDPTARMQLPAITIETVPQRTSRGHELGSTVLRATQDVMLTVSSENKYERDIITDILANQKDKEITLFDIDKVNAQNKMPLTYDGQVNPSGLTYKDIIQNPDFYWADAFIEDAIVSEVQTNNPNLYMSKIRLKLQIIK